MGRPEAFPVDDGLAAELSERGPHLRDLYLKEHQPNGKIGILYQNDDYGKDYVKGLKDGLGDKAKVDDRRGAALRDDRPDRRFADRQPEGGRRRCVRTMSTIPKFAAQAIRRRPRSAGSRCTCSTAFEFGRRRAEAGGSRQCRGHRLTTFYLKDPTDPTWKDDPGFKEWPAFMDKYYPEGDKTDGFNVDRLFRRADADTCAEAVRRRI